MDAFEHYAHDYALLCRQPVTVYRESGGEVTRTVHGMAYMDWKRTENVDRTGSEGSSGFLLVVPGPTLACREGDRVFDGIGPEVPDDAMRWWRGFIPSKVEGLATVRWSDPKKFGGRIVHTEAGG